MPMRFPIPPEGLDFELALEFRWTWAELVDTPLLIRQLWTRLLMAKRAEENRQLERMKDDGPATEADRVNAEREIAEAQAIVAAEEARKERTL